MLFFDHNATTPISETALRTYACSLKEDWQNPSALYREASRVKAKFELERERLALLIGCKKESIIFNSGATESNNAIFSHFSKNNCSASHCLISPFEHPSIKDAARYYFNNRVLYMPISKSGEIDLSKIEQILDRQKIVLVSLMAANNETGILQPWLEVSEICKKRGVFFHCDSTQFIGKRTPVELNQCSSFCASAHKFSGPKGMGFFVSKIPIQFQTGGLQEGSLRAGTENFPAIKAMVSAYSEIHERLVSVELLAEFRDQFEQKVCAELPDIRILGSQVPRLWNTSMLITPKYDNLSWVSKLDKLGFAVSTGSACSIGKLENDSISKAFGLSRQESRRLIRVSSYFSTKLEDWLSLASAFGEAFDMLNAESSQSSVISI